MSKKQTLIDETNNVIASYSTKLSLRQIYYRLVSSGIIQNKDSEYKYLSSALVAGRLTGQIGWHAIEDRTRDFNGRDWYFISPEDYFEAKKEDYESFKSCASHYYLPKWLGQEYYVEVWEEKNALARLFSDALRRKNVTLAVCKGYPSITYLYDAAQRIKAALEGDEEIEEKKGVILYFGDFDPSGKDIERNIRDRFQQDFELDVIVKRVVITESDISKYDLIPMPTKKSDSRSKKFIDTYGDVSSVELDAIDPDILMRLVRESVEEYFDDDIYATRNALVDDGKDTVQELIDELLSNGGSN